MLRGRPQGELERHAGIGYELVLALDAPVLHVVEEEDAFQVALLGWQQQVTAQAFRDVSVSSSLVRASQPMEVEQVLDVPVLREDEFDNQDWWVLDWLEQSLAEETPEVQVLPQALSDSLHAEMLVLRERVQQRFGGERERFSVPLGPCCRVHCRQLHGGGDRP